MINVIWAIMMMSSVFYMIFSGHSEKIITSITNGASSAVELCISLTGIYCFWCGLMRIAEESKLTDKLARLLSPLLKRLFKGASSEAIGAISMNMTSNMLGLGNTATPYGLKAMSLLQKESGLDGIPSHNMVLLAVINSASLQIIPTTVISLRSQMGAIEPASIVATTVLSTFVTAFVGILLCKLISRLSRR